MFDAVQHMAFTYVLAGIIWATALGFAVGNYACSLVYRLPRGRLILDKKPYCGHCGTTLSVQDLFPVVSALMLKHRCRYCNTPFPVSHTWTELLVGLLFVLAFFEHNFTERYILIVTIGVFLVTLAAIEANEHIIMGKIIVCIAVFGMLYRTLQDGTIYSFFQGGMSGLIFGAVIWRKHIKPVGHIYSLPKPVELLALGGLCVGTRHWVDFILLYTAFYGFFWLLSGSKRVVLSVPFGLAVILPVLYPKLTLISLFKLYG